MTWLGRLTLLSVPGCDRGSVRVDLHLDIGEDMHGMPRGLSSFIVGSPNEDSFTIGQL